MDNKVFYLFVIDIDIDVCVWGGEGWVGGCVKRERERERKREKKKRDFKNQTKLDQPI